MARLSRTPWIFWVEQIKETEAAKVDWLEGSNKRNERQGFASCAKRASARLGKLHRTKPIMAIKLISPETK